MNGCKKRKKMQKRVGKLADLVSDLPGPAQSREPGQAEPVSAGPGQAISDGPAMALAGLRISESQSHRPRPWLCTKFVSPYFWSFFSFFFFFDVISIQYWLINQVVNINSAVQPVLILTIADHVKITVNTNQVCFRLLFYIFYLQFLQLADHYSTILTTTMMATSTSW